MGSKGSVLVTKSSISCAPSFNVDVVDTVGCGDSYTAAIALGYLHNMSGICTLTLANAVGAATAASMGAGRNVATLDKVLGILRESNLNEDGGEFWRELFEGNLEEGEVFLLSARKPVDGDDDRFVHVPARNVGHQLISKFE
ncbi:uncharacterized protein A4U43_C02F21630 [Asparagus officinalis]|uniref:Carbohydrate kinase PfkB domain-containing protein n=1 Tax=Asparagus officinalis TaxID=4686 RepID=A0A5P1FPX7_ASPOF|nr:uncharacterized protein A4U43_C02F21630 [Asparagus officinalis]